MRLPDLHDWTLAELRVALDTNEVSLGLVGPSGSLCLVGTGLLSLSLERQMPWGPSVSINESSLTREGDTDMLFLELQSGDVLKLRARAIAIG
jgi:hypothetical protein